jgi:TolB protein
VARPITQDSSDYREVSATDDGATVLAVHGARTANIWIAPAVDTSHPKQVTFTNFDGLGGVAWMPDGRLVYTLTSGGEEDLWLTDTAEGAPQQLTRRAGLNRQPTVSPDGRHIVFVSTRDGRPHLWRIDADGRHPTQLTHGAEDIEPSVAPDGRQVFFRWRPAEGQTPRIARISLQGGQPASITEGISAEPAVSPDGRLVGLMFRPAPAAPNQLVVMPTGGGNLEVLSEFPAHFGRFRWTPDSRGLAYADRALGVGNIYVQPLDGGPPEQLTRWDTEPVFAFDWSQDGKWLAFSRGALTSEAVAITDVSR